MTPVILVADDDPLAGALVENVAVPLGFRVVSQPARLSIATILPAVAPDALFIDPGDRDQAALLGEVASADPECHVVLTARHGSVDAAVDAMKAGALDYLSKPFDAERLRAVLVTVRKRVERRETLLRLDTEVAKQFEFRGMVGRSPVMQELFDTIRRLAPHLRTVLVTGETGTGKELVAKALHQLGPRCNRRLLTLNCSAVVETLFESELFGHVRGAFTGATETKVGLFEHADTGTIFLDEVGELPLSLQAKLLRAVEYGEVQRVGALETRSADVCLIAATNRDLSEEAAAGRFRSDLYYRLGIVELYLVPLRERREDIPYLTSMFIRQSAERLKRPIVGITTAAERLLQTAPWPGNIRQLRHAIERACLMTDGRILTERELKTAIAGGAGGAHRTAPVTRGPSKTVPSQISRDQIERALRRVSGNKSAAAQELGVSRRSFYRWIDRLDMRG